MNIVLVSIGNFQEYIITNIEQHFRLGHTNIYVLTNRQFFERLSQFGSRIKLIAVEDLHDTYDYNNRSKLNKVFRGGFWLLASSRFFYLYAFMKTYNIEHVIHFENDVLVYRDCSLLLDKCKSDKMYVPFDTFDRNIASIMYIPNHTVFKTILDQYDNGKNDMENFSFIQKTTGLIETLPIFITNNDTPEHTFVTKHYEHFQCIFDAAAMGQYLGGVDPRNKPGDTRGFVNETCIIKYDKYEFIWRINENGIKQPFLIVGNETIPIFNLHIHSKQLTSFI
jgi:hypothetical protein